MDTSRRSALKVVGVTVCGLAGCTSTETDETTSAPPTTETTGTPHEISTSTPSIDQSLQHVTFEAEMLAQQSAESPARFEARLANTGSETVTFGMGPTLLFSDSDPDKIKWADDLVIDPDTFIGPWSDPVQSGDGCWRFPEDGYQGVQSIYSYSTIEPSDSMTERYSVYTDASVSGCLPAGRYTFQDISDFFRGDDFFQDEDDPADPDPRTVVLTLHIDSAEDQQLSVSAESPELQSS